MMRASLKRIATLSKRNLTEILRDPISVLLSVALPLLLEIVFYFIFHNMTAQFGMRFLAPGIVVFAQAFLSLFTGLLISQDRGSSFLTRLYVTGARSYEFIFGYALALLPVAAAQGILFFIVGGAIEPDLFTVGMLWGILLAVVTGAFYIGAGILLGSVCNEKAIGAVASIVITGQSVLSGMWFPQEGLGKGMLTVMRVLPFKNATDLVQNAVNGQTSFSSLVVPLLITLAYTVAVFFAAVFAFRAKMKEK